MSAGCIGEPISWLRLELYQLGKLPEAERAGVAQHLGACPACGQCLAQLKADDAKPLAPLPEKRVAVPFRRRAVFVAAAGLAAAAALVVVVATRPSPGDLPIPYRGITGDFVKGGEVEFTLVRSDGTEITGDDGVFRDGDAFAVLVTCWPKPNESVHFDLVVYDSSGASFPIAAREGFRCRNNGRMGTFAFTGHETEKVCLVWSWDQPDRKKLAPGVAGTHSICRTLTSSK